MKTTMMILSILCYSVLTAEPTTVTDITQVELTQAPGQDPQDMIVKHIEAAKTRVWVMAYNFTNVPIAQALAKAKLSGIDVIFVGDRSVKTESKSMLNMLSEAKILCFLDAKHPIMHDKVMIIDDNLVVTGSFNFSTHALKNAENCIVVTSKAMNKFYDAIFTTHRQHSVEYEGEAP